MSKNKLTKFAEMEAFPNVFQCSAQQLQQEGMRYPMRGKWNEKFFGNSNPIILELGCGRGEYSVAMAEMFADKNFIGVDIKGARMWAGAKRGLENGLKNVAFLRTNIEMLGYFFAENEVSEIWLTFPDPQMKKTTKRLTSIRFLEIYSRFMVDGGLIHLKTDSNFMFSYTRAMIEKNQFLPHCTIDNIYSAEHNFPLLNIKTYYEQQWLARGIDIKYLNFALPRKAVYSEPEIEIEKDTYRSFGRNLI
ncbi:MAG: tRNA (guanosine(46)-N7)-methyltransferase TrmB [Paludibacter sp.]|jgi:tRNA (guanine-N7-)-methyltransferase|nr:tRNA (guanosine(46)-N7)-methyltransferase TrmB [Paludibacter sp.]